MIEEISKSINEYVFARMRKRSLTVFLVGAGQKNPASIRESIRRELTRRRYYSWFDVYYPEELFEELMRSKAHFDLLSLENLLAKSVHAVVIILESPGAIAELAAFANHKGLRDRLIVIVDKKYEKAKSFIILGPVRYLKKDTESSVIFYNLRNPDIRKLGEQIRHDVRETSKRVQVDTSVMNPIAAQYFFLAAVYVMEPIQRKVLNNMIQAVQVQPLKKKEVVTIVISSLNILLRNEEVILQGGKYRLTKEGLKRFRAILKLEPEGRNIEYALDKLRVKVLNRTLRRQKVTMR